MLIVTGLGVHETNPRRYSRRWTRWPCRVERGRIVPLADVLALASSTPPKPYSPFEVYYAVKRGDETPHFALARRGWLPIDEVADLAQREYSPTGTRDFFRHHGCDHRAALEFASRWGLLGEGWVGAQGEAEVPLKGIALWEFRWQASYVRVMLDVWSAIRRADEHSARLLLQALWWLAGIAEPLPSDGWLPGISRSERGSIGFQRVADTFDGRGPGRATQVQRAAQLLHDLLNIELAEVRPRTVYSVDPHGKPHLTATLTTDTLLQAILAMVYLDVTGHKDVGECALWSCAALFHMSAHKRTAEDQGKRVYCCRSHATRATSLRSTEKNREHVRAQARERKRRQRAKESQEAERAAAAAKSKRRGRATPVPS